MSDDHIDQPLLAEDLTKMEAYIEQPFALNESLKDSVEQPVSHNASVSREEVEPIQEEEA
jgi:hypothetical protein